MSKKTRINRPTTATPTRPREGRRIFTSTLYGNVSNPDGSYSFVKRAKGITRRVPR